MIPFSFDHSSGIVPSRDTVLGHIFVEQPKILEARNAEIGFHYICSLSFMTALFPFFIVGLYFITDSPTIYILTPLRSPRQAA